MLVDESLINTLANPGDGKYQCGYCLYTSNGPEHM